MDDTFIKEKYKNVQLTNKLLSKIPENEILYLMHRFNDSESIKESIFRIIIDLIEKPICPECNNPVKIRYRKSNPYYHTCGSADCIHKRKYNGPAETNMKKYGVKNQFQREEIKEQIRQQNITKYGVDNIMKSPEFKMIYENKIYEKYGVKNQFQREEIKEQIRQQNITKYGVDHISKTKQWKENQSRISGSKEFQEKRNHTLAINKTWNSSKDEEYIYSKLTTTFNSVIRQYSSKDYPYLSDFYIVDIDTYIEYNGSDLHGFRPYLGTVEDINEVKELIDKSNKLKKKRHNNKKTRYDNRIYTWTDLDVRKRNIAKENNLKLMEFWNVTEFNKWLQQFIHTI